VRATAFEQEETDVAAEETNAAQIVSAYEAFSRGNIQSVLTMLAEDILWHVPGRGPLSRNYRGPDEVL
jgi:uncharacterized protein